MTEEWELKDEAMLALAVESHGSDWDSIAMEVQRGSSLCRDLTTACQCRLKYEELTRRFENLNPRPKGVSSVWDMAVRAALELPLKKLREEMAVNDFIRSMLNNPKAEAEKFTERLRSLVQNSEKPIKWDSVNDFLLACLVTRHEASDWESIAVDVQSITSLPRELVTAEKCRLKYEQELLPRYGEDFFVVAEEEAKRNMAWGLRDAFLLACASMLHGRDWDAISSEVRKRSSLSDELTTARNCMLKYRDLICTFGVGVGDAVASPQETFRNLICTIGVMAQVYTVPGENVSALRDLLSSDLANAFLELFARAEDQQNQNDTAIAEPCQEIEHVKDVVFVFGTEVVLLEKERVSDIKKTISKLETTFNDAEVQLEEMTRTLEANFRIVIPIPDHLKYRELRRTTAVLRNNYPDYKDESDNSSTGGCPYTFLEDDDVLPFEETLEQLERRHDDLILQLASHKKKFDDLLEKSLPCRF